MIPLLAVRGNIAARATSLFSEGERRQRAPGLATGIVLRGLSPQLCVPCPPLLRPSVSPEKCLACYVNCEPHTAVVSGLPALGTKVAVLKLVSGMREKNGGVQFYKDQLSTGLALDIRQEKIFAFVFYKLTRKQTSSKRLDCISSALLILLLVVLLEH